MSQYENGYNQALLDLYKLVSRNTGLIYNTSKSKEDVVVMARSLLLLLLRENDKQSLFRHTHGNVCFSIQPITFKVTDIKGIDTNGRE